jgi:hypothetical protein
MAAPMAEPTAIPTPMAFPDLYIFFGIILIIILKHKVVKINKKLIQISHKINN